MTLGIMQGRLSPPVENRFQCFPRESWEREIALAPQAGLDAIEWIYDQFGDGANPLENDQGTDRVRALGTKHGVIIESICADWFMEELLIGGTPAEREVARARLDWLIGRAALLGIKRIVLPFVDASALTSDILRLHAREAIEEALSRAKAAGTELHLETSLGPEEFASFLSTLPDPTVKVNYDIGNSASLGYSPAEEFAAYGPRIGSVHIKDRVLHGSTVALGTGNADFDAVFSGLAAVRYVGPFILQAARGEPGDEVRHSRKNVAFAQRLIGPLLSLDDAKS